MPGTSCGVAGSARLAYFPLDAYVACMKTSDFDFELPEALIAQHPPERRDLSRMMALDRRTGETAHRSILDFPEHLRPGDTLVLNNTRVIPARTFGAKESGGKVECLFVEPVDGVPDEWLVMMKSSRRPKPGSTVSLPGGMDLTVLENRTDGLNRVRAAGPMEVMDLLREHGHTPLPPYIHREADDPEDPERYQTVYASRPGAVAAPTAGLHFTPGLLEEIRSRGVDIVELTLHVGPGTFRPVKAEKVTDHRMDEERYEVPEETARILNATRERGGRVVAVGSTSVRTLETVVRPDGSFPAGSGRSGIYIYPPFTYRAVDAILTNFHLPRSTLLMMMSAFSHRGHLLKAYAEAVEAGYRFFSYGDCMLIEDSSL